MQRPRVDRHIGGALAGAQYRGDHAMSNAGTVHGLDPVAAVFDLLFVAVVLGQIGLLSVRRWAGHIVPDYAGWEPGRILVDQRFRLGLGLLLALVWASIAIALVRHALQPGVVSLPASHLGPLPIPQWIAFLMRDGHRLGIVFALWATSLWLDRSISKHWSAPARTLGGQSFMAVLLAFMAIALSVLY
jgi:hypothetical protein